MPAERTVYNWLAESDHPFLQRYTRAREIQAERLADEIVSIADDEAKDVPGDAVRRSHLRVESRKWVAAKLLPKKYGDKIQQEVTGNLGLQLVHSIPRPGDSE